MKRKVKECLNKISKILLVMLMTLTCINLQGIKNVNAVTLDYQAVSSAEKSAQMTVWGTHHSGYQLKMGGSYGFCLDMGQAFRSGKYYDRNTLSGVPTIVRKAMHWYYAGTASDVRYWTAQIIIWGVMEGKISDPYEDFLKVGDELEIAYKAVYGESVPSGYWGSLGETCRDISQGSSEGTYYSYTYTAGYQRIATNAKGYIPVADSSIADSTKQYSVTDRIQLNINKTDVDTTNGLAGVEFDLYRDNVKIATVTTGSDGKASHTFEKVYAQSGTATVKYCDNYDELSPDNKALVGSVDFTSEAAAQAEADKQALAKAKSTVQDLLDEKHEYKAVETKTRTAYYLDASKNTVTKDYASGNGSGSVTFSMTNKRQLGSITITKRDSETDNLVNDAVYGLYARSNIVHPDGHTGTLYTKDQLVGTFVKTAANGTATLNNLYLGQYYVSEITAPSGYLHSSEKYNVDLTYAGQNVQITDSSSTVKDKVQRARINAVKKDKELNNGSATIDFNGDGAQGDATRTGAVYGLYARDNITHADGTTGIVTYNSVAGSIHELKATKGTELSVKNTRATAGALLATIKTDANGEFGFDHLYNGKYFIKEITASTGYLLDSTEYDIDLSYTNQNETVVTKNSTELEQVKKQAFDLVKVGHVPGSSTNAKPLQNIEFSVWLESDIQRLMAEGQTLAQAKVNAPLYDKLITDVEGKASSKELPYGTYRVAETKPAIDYATADDFFVTVSEDSRVHQTFTNNIIIDEQFSALIKAVKLDKETGKQVKLPDTTFKIKALSDVVVDGKKFAAGEYIGYWNWNIFDGFYTDTWKTNEDGYVLINEKLGAGSYQLEEIHAPKGYVLDTTPIKFAVTNQNMYEIADDGKTPVINTYKSDVSVKGQISVEKKGEVLVDYKDGQFIYEERGLADAQYEIRAKADIMDPSNDGTVLYKAGTVVETLTTGSDGKATSKKLPLGEYTVEEIKAPHGMTLNKEKQDTTLEYEDENTPLVFDSASYVNERQKVNLDLNKLDLDEKVPLKGATFTIFANKDILNADGQIIVKKGDKITSAISDEDGKLIFDIDLPIDIHSNVTNKNDDLDPEMNVNIDKDGNILLGNTDSMFFVKETARPVGYTTLKAILYLDTTYQGQDKKDFTIAYDFYNEMTRVEFTKTDITTGNPVAGAQLSVVPVDKDGKPDVGAAFDTWITMPDDPKTKDVDESIHLIRGLEPGDYVLREVLGQAAELGYVTSQDVKFTVTDTFEVQKVEMKDDYTKVEISKTDITTGNPVIGTQLSVIPVDEDGKPNVGATFDTWITGEKPHKIEYLPIGDYILREKLTGQAWDYGYVTANDVKFTVTDTGKLQKVEMQDDYTKVEISKTDITTGNPVIGTQLSVIPVDENGKPDVGATFDTWITDENAHHIERIPVGKYILREKLTGQAWDYGYVTAEDVEFEVKDTGEIQKVEMKDDYTKIELTKVDVNDEAVAGATMTIVPLDEDDKPLMGEAFDTWTTQLDNPETKDVDESIHKIEYLPIGKYMMIELSAPNEFVKAQPIEFEVKDTGEVQKAEMKDKQIEISKVDVTTGEELPGAELTVTDKETDTVVDKWISGDETHFVSGLEEGKTYILTEVTAPDGFVKAENIEFTVTEDKVNQKVEMKDKQVEISKVDVTTGEELPGAELTVTDKETDTVVDKWTSGDETHFVSGLEEGKTYILTEVTAPNGFYKAENIEFTVTKDKVNQKIEMKDSPILTDILVHKVDSQTMKAILSKDFEFTMYSDPECKNAITKVEGNTTDGTATFKDVRFGTYYIKETKAPLGYKLSNEVKKVIINDELTGVGDVYSFIYLNTLMPETVVKTQDDNNLMALGLAGLVSFAGIYASKKRKRKENQ